MRNKLLLTLLLALLIGVIAPSVAFGGPEWRAQTSQAGCAISFVDADNGWAVGTSGLIRHTTDGGVTWTSQHSQTGSSLNGVSFVDLNNGWAVGYAGSSGVVMRTSDGGSTWTSHALPTTDQMTGVRFIDSSHGWVVGGRKIYHTDDGGVNWTVQATVTNMLRAVAFTDANNGWAVGDSGGIVRTTDGGTTWVTQTSGTTNQLNGIAAVSANDGWVVGASGTVRHTTNGGATWSTQNVGTTNTLRGVTFTDANHGWAVGQYRLAVYTSDGGATWTSHTATPLQIGDDSGVCAVGPDRAWVIGGDFNVRRTVDGGASWSNLTVGLWTPQSVSFPDSNNGWVAGGIGGSATLRHTTNGGASWHVQSPPFTWATTAIDFIDANNGWIVAGSSIAHTADGGTSWTTQTSWTTNTLNRVKFLNANKGYAIGKAGTICNTINGGAHWAAGTVGTQDLYDISFGDANVGCIVGRAGTILRTTNGGQFTAVNASTTASLNGVSFADANNGWIVGSPTTMYGPGTILHTTDGGATWAPQTAGNSVNFYDVQFVDAYTGWASGQEWWPREDVVYKTTDGGATWALESDSIGGGLLEMDFADSTHGWGVGSGSLITKYSDLTPPTSTITSPVDGAMLRGATCTISGTASDADSDIGSVKVSTDGGTTWHTATGTTSWSYEWTLPADGTYTIRSRAFDTEGNPESPGAGITVTVDNTAPVTQLITSPSSPDGANGWFKTTPTLTLSIGEPGTIYYQWDSTSSEGWLPYLAPFSAPSGAHTLNFYSVDLVGNVELFQSVAVNTDGDAPATDARIGGTIRHDSWWVTDVVVSLTSDDGTNGSGIGSTEYSFNGTDWSVYTTPVTISDEGTTTIYYRSSDVAGNTESAKQRTVTADKTAPSTTGAVSGTLGASGWYISDVVLSLSATDTGGSDLVGTESSFGDYTSPITISREGTTVVDYCSVDGAGNRESVHTQTIKVDKVAPSTSVALTGVMSADGTYAPGLQVTLCAEDSLCGSGVLTTEYSLDGEHWSSYASPFTISAGAATTVSYRSADVAGNAETTGHRTVTITQ